VIGAVALASSVALGADLAAVVALVTYLGLLVGDVTPSPAHAVLLGFLAVLVWSLDRLGFPGAHRPV